MAWLLSIGASPNFEVVRHESKTVWQDFVRCWAEQTGYGVFDRNLRLSTAFDPLDADGAEKVWNTTKILLSNGADVGAPICLEPIECECECYGLPPWDLCASCHHRPLSSHSTEHNRLSAFEVLELVVPIDHLEELHTFKGMHDQAVQDALFREKAINELPRMFEDSEDSEDSGEDDGSNIDTLSEAPDAASRQIERST